MRRKFRDDEGASVSYAPLCLILSLMMLALLGCLYFILVKRNKALAIACAILAAIPAGLLIYAFTLPHQYSGDGRYLDGAEIWYDPYASRPIDLATDLGLNRSVFDSIDDDTFAVMASGGSFSSGGYYWFQSNFSGNGSLAILSISNPGTRIHGHGSLVPIAFQFVINSKHPALENLTILEPDNRFNVTFTYSDENGIGFRLPPGQEHTSGRIRCQGNGAAINLLEDVGDSSVKGSLVFHMRLRFGYVVE